MDWQWLADTSVPREANTNTNHEHHSRSDCFPTTGFAFESFDSLLQVHANLLYGTICEPGTALTGRLVRRHAVATSVLYLINVPARSACIPREVVTAQ
jgi:hypothetical protein